MSIAWAALLLREQLDWATVVGGLAVIACAGLAVRARLDREGRPDAPHAALPDDRSGRGQPAVRNNPWATFVSATSAGLVASHYPVLLDEDRTSCRSSATSAARTRSCTSSASTSCS